MFHPLFVIVALLVAAPAQALEVPCWEILMTSVVKFQAHTENHIRRVTILGMELHRAFPREFPLVQPHLLAEFLSLHDQSKVNRTAPFLRKHGLESRAEPLIATLYRNSGRWDQLTEAERNAIRDELNTVDERVAHDFFARNGLLDADGKPGAAAQQYLRIEKLADSVDTVLSVARGEEFGKFPRIGLDHMHVSQGSDWRYVRHLARYYRRRVRDADDHLFLGREGYDDVL
jgi:hypothetical protein